MQIRHKARLWKWAKDIRNEHGAILEMSLQACSPVLSWFNSHKQPHLQTVWPVLCMHTWPRHTQRELCINSRFGFFFFWHCLFRRAYHVPRPPPILFCFSVRRKWSHNENKKSYHTFCPLPPPPSSQSSPHWTTPPQLDSSVTSSPAWRRNDKPGHLPTSDPPTPEASVSARSAHDPSQSNGIVLGRVRTLPRPQDPAKSPRSPVRHLFWR